MQRLREQSSSSDPAIARAAALLSAMPPLDGDRVRIRPLPPLEGGRRASVLRVRVALVLAISLASVAAAAANLRGSGWLGGSRWTGARTAASVAPRPGAVVASSPEMAVAGATAQAPEAQPDPGVPAVERLTEVAAAHSLAPPRAHATAGGQLHATSKESTRTSAASSSADESALIVGAVRALRRDGDPGRAMALAEESLQRYPQGVQVEEAMALAMEAAAAEGNASAAHQAAQRYVTRFPAGRFADRAARILATPAR